MRIHKGDQKAVAKPLCLCATCAALTNKSLEDTLNSAPAKLRQQSAKLVVHLCRQVRASHCRAIQAISRYPLPYL